MYRSRRTFLITTWCAVVLVFAGVASAEAARLPRAERLREARQFVVLSERFFNQAATQTAAQATLAAEFERWDACLGALGARGSTFVAIANVTPEARRWRARQLFWPQYRAFVQAARKVRWKNQHMRRAADLLAASQPKMRRALASAGPIDLCADIAAWQAAGSPPLRANAPNAYFRFPADPLTTAETRYLGSVTNTVWRLTRSRADARLFGNAVFFVPAMPVRGVVPTPRTAG